MKTLWILLLLPLLTLAQQNEKSWKKVVALESEGKITSANRRVTKIYSKASKHRDEPEIIKCFFYQSKYWMITEEDAQVKILENLASEIRQASPPSQAILLTVYAGLLDDYRQSRPVHSATPKNEKDFRKWDRNTMAEKIDSLYNRAISLSGQIRNIKISDFETVFDSGYRDELSDLSVFEYVLKDHAEYCFKQAVNKWYLERTQLTDACFSGETSVFLGVNPKLVGDPDLRKCVQAFQLLETHFPTVRNRILRLKSFKSIQPGKNYTIGQLKTLSGQAQHPIDKQEVQLFFASHLMMRANNKNGTDDFKQAIVYLDSILSVPNRSNAFREAEVLKKHILSRNLQLQCESTLDPEGENLALLTYKNISKIAVSFYRIPASTLPDYRSKMAVWDSLAKPSRLTATKEYTVPDPGDHFEHSAEIRLPKLPVGTYLMMTELSGPDTLAQKRYERIQVTHLSALARRLNETNHYTVLNRKTGKRLAGVKVSLGNASSITDENGLVRIPSDNNHRFAIEQFSVNGDTLSVERSYLPTIYTEYENAEATVKFYLDRHIYRPGQTVHFKGVAVLDQNGEHSVVKNKAFDVVIDGPEGNEVFRKEFITSEFGSFSGTFDLPKTLLTGGFDIYAEEPDSAEALEAADEFWDEVEYREHWSSFSVEEYKRPTFEITFDKITQDLKLNQDIALNGLAKSFSQANLNDVVVKYAITEGYTRPADTIRGETRTDKDGRFSIKFLAADSISSGNNLRRKRYSVKAWITDAKGETREAEQHLSAGNYSYQLRIEIPPVLQATDSKLGSLITTSLNGNPKTAKGKLKLYQLGQFSKKPLPRNWIKPEYPAMSDEEYEKAFPYRQNEKNQNTAKLVGEFEFDTSVSKSIPSALMARLDAGKYRLAASLTDGDFTISDSANFAYEKIKGESSPKLFTMEETRIGKKPALRIRSEIADLELLLNTSAHTNTTAGAPIKLERGSYDMLIPETEQELLFTAEAVFDGHHVFETLTVKAAETDIKPTIDVISFRDKMTPGSPETWSFRISPNEKGKPAEVLAAMYDSSLNSFGNPRSWTDLVGETQPLERFASSMRAEGNRSVFIEDYEIKSPILRNESPELIRFGFDFTDPGSISASVKYKKHLARKNRPAGTRLVYGIVTEEGLPLPGVNVAIQGTDRIASTDLEGHYEIYAKTGETLEFSFVGMKSETQKIGGVNLINLSMKPDDSMLSEVVVNQGYSSTNRASAATFVRHDKKSVLSILQGRVAGLSINGTPGGDSTIVLRGVGSVNSNNEVLVVVDGVPVDGASLADMDSDDLMDVTVLKDSAATSLYGNRGANGVIVITTKSAADALNHIPLRKNLQETAFFFPNLTTGKDGTVSINFTSPEALTTWSLRMLAHRKDATSALLEKSAYTQKDLMVSPNLPRFFRENDSIVIAASVSNLTKETKNGLARLQLFDAETGRSIDADAANSGNTRNFTAGANATVKVQWNIKIPLGLSGLQYRIVASSGNFSDGEEGTIAVLSNDILVIESVPIWVRENSKATFELPNLAAASNTRRNQSFTLEYHGNPVWMALESLPYLMEFEHECAEQTFARLFANVLAENLVNQHPEIKEIIASWGKAPASKLDKNPELKNLVLAETPWLLDAQNDGDRKKRLAGLLSPENAKSRTAECLAKLSKMQSESGGFPWFEGGYENDYITLHILSGFGHLKKLLPESDFSGINSKAIAYADKNFLYEQALDNVLQPSISNSDYLYMRSFYLSNHPLSDALKKSIEQHLDLIEKDLFSASLNQKIRNALILHRFGRKSGARKILEHLRETAASDDRYGMYWIQNTRGWGWYEAPVENQALAIEAFTEIENDQKTANALRVWLVKNKQRQNWSSTRATTLAVYALLSQEGDWARKQDNAVIEVGNQTILTKKLKENEKEAQTGYVKLLWQPAEITPDMASVSIKNKTDKPVLGGIYWQYFERLDNVSAQESDQLSVSRTMFLKKDGTLIAITPESTLSLGDRVLVQLSVEARSDFDFIHLKDLRASAFEPVDVKSGYDYQHGSGYYKSTRDAASHFFFDRLKKGIYVIEYEVVVNNLGVFSNGISTIQSMYAPEFSSHTSGSKISVK